MRGIDHLCRLLAEHLAKTKLEAAVGDLELLADEIHPLDEKSASLLPDVVNQAQSLDLVLECLAARLGPKRVLQAIVLDNVLFINRKEEGLKRLMSRLEVRVTTDQEVQGPS